MAETPKITEARIIGISGKQYAGKDLLADLLLARLPGFQKVPIAGAIKTAYANEHGLTLEALETNKAEHRPGLIAKGDWGRAIDPDYWLKDVLNQPGEKIISDVRMKREYDLLREHGAFMIRLEADRAVRDQRGMLVSEADKTETELDGIPESGWEVVLTNNGSVADLESQLNRLFT